MKKVNGKKFTFIMLSLLVFSLLTISIGFSSLSTSLTVNGNLAFVPIDMIRVTSISADHLAASSEQSKGFSLDKINIQLTLDNLSSEAIYNVTIKNFGQVQKVFAGCSTVIFSNENMTYELVGLKLGDSLGPKETLDFQIKLKYKNNVSVIDETKLNAVIKFNFATHIENENTYFIVFDANGGTGIMNSMLVPFDEDVNLYTNNYYKTGHYFEEWNTRPDGSGTSFTNGQNVTNLGKEVDDVFTLYAIWHIKEGTYYAFDRCTFNGIKSVIEGDCEGDYLVNTHFTPFSMEDYTKNFDMRFTISEASLDRFSTNGRDTIFNMLYENNDNIKGTYPGMLLRIEGGRWMMQGSDGRTSNKLYFDKSELIGKEIRFIRYNSGDDIKVYYMIGDSEPYLLKDMTNLYAPFDTFLTIGASTEVDNSPWRYSYSTIENFSFAYLDNNMSLSDIISGQPTPPVENETLTVEGPCIFDGNALITGDNCSDYHNVKYINTGIYLFTQDKIEKEFDISFNISGYVPANQPENQVTVMNAFLERTTGKGYGFLIRRDRNNLTFIIRDGNGTDKQVSFAATGLNSFRIVKKGSKVCYSTNGGNLKYIIDYSNFASPFDVPLTFGASINSSKVPFRYIKGTLSNISVVSGQIDENIVCNESMK